MTDYTRDLPDLPDTEPAPAPTALRDDLPLRIVPLGGFGEFGMNMLCYEVGDERIIVDCGGMFPDTDLLGVDLVIPDIHYLLAEPERLKAIVLTHLHEDHVGALPYILSQIQAPVYATPLTLAYLDEKLEEHHLAETPDMRELVYRDWVSIGEHFRIQALHVTHSVPDAAAIAIRTPAGVVVHSGDYKIDHSPIDGEPFDLYSFSRLGEEGVLALVADSTNANVPGSSHTERWVERHLSPIFSTCENALFCTTFSSSVHRLQVLLNLAVRFGRRVAVVGRSLERTFRIASSLGYLNVPPNLLLPMRDIESVPRERRMIIATGSQGEPASAMGRLARDEHKDVSIEEGDTVIISAREIPNNVRAIAHLINHLCRRGAHVFTPGSHQVHASGHACREEMKALLSLTRPRFLIPAHGEMRQLLAHREMAESMGFAADSIFVLEDGEVLEFAAGGPGDARGAWPARAEGAGSKIRGVTARIVDKVEVGHVLVDGKTVGETGEAVLRDRRHLSEDGMVIVILNVDRTTGALLTPPEIVTRGFVFVDESEELIETLRTVTRDAFEALSAEAREDSDVTNAEIRRALKRYIRRRFERFPLILPVVQEL